MYFAQVVITRPFRKSARVDIQQCFFEKRKIAVRYIDNVLYREFESNGFEVLREREMRLVGVLTDENGVEKDLWNDELFKEIQTQEFKEKLDAGDKTAHRILQKILEYYIKNANRFHYIEMRMEMPPIECRIIEITDHRVIPLSRLRPKSRYDNVSTLHFRVNPEDVKAVALSAFENYERNNWRSEGIYGKIDFRRLTEVYVDRKDHSLMKQNRWLRFRGFENEEVSLKTIHQLENGIIHFTELTDVNLIRIELQKLGLEDLLGEDLLGAVGDKYIRHVSLTTRMTLEKTEDYHLYIDQTYISDIGIYHNDDREQYYLLGSFRVNRENSNNNLEIAKSLLRKYPLFNHCQIDNENKMVRSKILMMLHHELPDEDWYKKFEIENTVFADFLKHKSPALSGDMGVFDESESEDESDDESEDEE